MGRCELHKVTWDGNDDLDSCYVCVVGILNDILDDSTGDSTGGKRTWPIRAANYRTAKNLLSGRSIDEMDSGGWLK